MARTLPTIRKILFGFFDGKGSEGARIVTAREAEGEGEGGEEPRATVVASGLPSLA
jgi:hypothetical protein